jgi:serine/threonine protein kinase
VNSAAPEFIYEPIAFSQLPLYLLAPEVKFVDFGHMVRTTSPLDSDEIGYNAPYAAPELILMHKPSKEADVWALACVLFEMRAGRQMFRGFFGSEEEIVDSMENILGDLPESWKRQWKTRLAQDLSNGAVQASTEPIGKDAETHKVMTVDSAHEVQVPHTLQNTDPPHPGYFRQAIKLITSDFPGWLRSWRASHSELHEKGSIIKESGAESSLHQVIQQMGTWPKHLSRSPESRKSMILRSSQTPDEGDEVMDLEWVDCLKPPPATLSIEEAEDFESLLSGMLKYDPEERISLEELRDHPWLSKSYPDSSEDNWLERWF